MYIQKAEIKNIKSIEHFEIEFPNPAGWHVLIGDNGSGKSTIVRAISLVLVGEEVFALRPNWNDWLNRNSSEGTIELKIFREKKFDVPFHPSSFAKYLKKHDPHYFHNSLRQVRCKATLSQNGETRLFTEQENLYGPDFRALDDKITLNEWSGWFSASYGPYRRFEGGNKELEKLYEIPAYSKLVAHLSIFGEDVALTKATEWLQDLFNQSNDPTLPKVERKDKSNQLENIKRLINSEGFLPNNTRLKVVNSQGVFFRDGSDARISVNQMSDGYRSILSMTFELIRQLVRVYGSEAVFKDIEKNEINLPGVVLVDEIDAHLHPTWQTRIGHWFLKYFPQLQFIVTTHSPLVCRAAERGSIWRLAAPGSDEKSGEVTGKYRDRLIHGNILDAYGTELFGTNMTIDENSNDLLNRLSELNVKSMMGLINDLENTELQELRAKFPTENKIKK